MWFLHAKSIRSHLRHHYRSSRQIRRQIRHRASAHSPPTIRVVLDFLNFSSSDLCIYVLKIRAIVILRWVATLRSLCRCLLVRFRFRLIYEWFVDLGFFFCFSRSIDIVIKSILENSPVIIIWYNINFCFYHDVMQLFKKLRPRVHALVRRGDESTSLSR